MDVFSLVSLILSKKGGGGGFPGDKYFEGGYADVVLKNATRLKSYAFYQDSSLKTISLPKVAYIEQYAIYNCANLSEINLAEGLIDIGMSAISGGKYDGDHVKKLVIPSTVKSIGYSAFASLAGLETVTFLGTPTTIGATFMPAFGYSVQFIYCPWAEGEVAGAPWGAASALIMYNYTGG